MRIRTPRASVWVDDATETSPTLPVVTSVPVTPSPRGPAQVRWADRPYSGRLGRYVAVRLRGDLLEVAVIQQDNSLCWVRATTAMTSAEAREWMADGFPG